MRSAIQRGWHCPATLPVCKAIPMGQHFFSFTHCCQRMMRAETSSANPSAFQHRKRCRHLWGVIQIVWTSAEPAPWSRCLTLSLTLTTETVWVTFSKWVWRTFHRAEKSNRWYLDSFNTVGYLWTYLFVLNAVCPKFTLTCVIKVVWIMTLLIADQRKNRMTASQPFIICIIKSRLWTKVFFEKTCLFGMCS